MPQPTRGLGMALLLASLALAFACAMPLTIDQIEASLMRSANVKRRGPGLRVVPVYAGSPISTPF